MSESCDHSSTDRILAYLNLLIVVRDQKIFDHLVVDLVVAHYDSSFLRLISVQHFKFLEEVAYSLLDEAC